MADHEKSKDRLKEITDSIEQGIRDLFQSDRYAQYLRTMSRFHRYSVNNTMLIYMQKPDASVVAGFNKWRDQFSRNVRRGEHGIKIIAPTPFKKRIEQEKLDPDTKIPMRDADGNIIMEEKEIKIPMYKVVSVFDVSQTEGKPLPTLANNLTGNVQQYAVFMEALRRSSPVPMGFEAMESDTDGYFSGTDQRIAIRTGMSEVQTVAAAVHEITHATLHNYEQARLAAVQGDETAEPPKPKDRHTE
jgi:antirestriction protein ArdC